MMDASERNGEGESLRLYCFFKFHYDNNPQQRALIT
jgi:hypothetical protein